MSTRTCRQPQRAVWTPRSHDWRPHARLSCRWMRSGSRLNESRQPLVDVATHGQPILPSAICVPRRGHVAAAPNCAECHFLPDLWDKSHMTESVQRILIHRALDGTAPASPEDIMRYGEETARGWNADPTPFVWAGRRHLRRQRAYLHRHPLGGSGACSARPIRRRPVALTYTGPRAK